MDREAIKATFTATQESTGTSETTPSGSDTTQASQTQATAETPSEGQGTAVAGNLETVEGEQAKPLDEFEKKFVALTKREKAFRQQKETFKAEQIAAQKEKETLNHIRETAKTSKLEALELFSNFLGEKVTYDELTLEAINGGGYKAKQEIDVDKVVAEKLSEFEKNQLDKQIAAQREQTDKKIDDHRAYIGNIITTEEVEKTYPNISVLSTIKKEDVIADIDNYMWGIFKKTKKVVTYKEALDYVEGEYDRLFGSQYKKRFESSVNGSAVSSEKDDSNKATVSKVNQANKPRTLTNALAGNSTTSTNKKESSEQRRARIREQLVKGD